MSAQTIFMALPAQGICRLAAPTQIEEVVFFLRLPSGHEPKGTLLLSVCPFTRVRPSLGLCLPVGFFLTFNQSCDFRQAWTQSQLGSPGPAATALLSPIGTSLKSSLQRIGLLLQPLWGLDFATNIPPCAMHSCGCVFKHCHVAGTQHRADLT